MSTTVKLILRTDYVGKEGCGINIRLTINRKSKNFPLYKYVTEDYWTDDANKPIKKGWPNYEKLNYFLKAKLADANAILLDHALFKKETTFINFEKEFCNSSNKDNFIAWASHELEEEIQPKISTGYYEHAVGYIKKVKEFRPELTMSGFDYEFCGQYENHLISLGNNQNTRYTNLKFFRMILNIAIAKKLIKENPFDVYKIKPGAPIIEYLTIEELHKVEQLMDYNLPNYLQNVLHYFLFACYTSLRFSDVEAFDKTCVEGDMIRIVMKKTKQEVRIPYMERIKKLLEKVNSDAFRVISNQKTNKYLRELIAMAGIDKYMTFNCSRHTFATIGLTIGIPLEVISELLGHKNIRTTKIYAKIVNALKVKSMQKWNEIPYKEEIKPELV